MSEDMQWQRQEGTGAPESSRTDDLLRRGIEEMNRRKSPMFINPPPFDLIPPQFRLTDEDKAWIRQMVHEEIRVALDDEERVEARIVTRG